MYLVTMNCDDFFGPVARREHTARTTPRDNKDGTNLTSNEARIKRRAAVVDIVYSSCTKLEKNAHFSSDLLASTYTDLPLNQYA